MEKRNLFIGDVVQLSPEKVGNKAFAGCFMVITDPKEWGAQGYVQNLGNSRHSPGTQAYYRAKWEEMEFIGKVEWIVGEEESP